MSITSITTRHFALNKHSFFKLLVSYRYKKRWWISAIALAFVLGLFYFNFKADHLQMAVSFFTVVIVGTALTLFSIWRFVSAKSTVIYYRSRYYVMDTEKVSAFIEDGSTNTTMIGSYSKVEEMSGYYLLYMGKAQYTAIPRSIFKTPEDLQWFETNIIGRIRTPGF